MSRYQWYGNRTYAQHGDDLVILNLFTQMGIEKPSYLDIGAHHPFEISNTALLYERGSCGINVEANPNLMPAFYSDRPLDINLNVGVAPGVGFMKFLLVDKTSGRNTFVPSALLGMRVVKEIDIEVTTVKSIIDQHWGGVFPDLLSIDIEGMDLPVLESLDFQVTFPKVICAEVVSGDVDYSEKMNSLLASRGYKLAFRAGCNIMYVRGD